MKIVLIGLFTLASFSAFAGVPSEDPIVKGLRDRFEFGIEPISYYLTSNTFQCVEYAAMVQDYRRVELGALGFVYDDSVGTFRTTTPDATSLTLANGELSGAGYVGRTMCVYYESYREDSEGTLIRESSEDCGNSGAILTPLSSFAAGKATVRAYSICTF